MKNKSSSVHNSSSNLNLKPNNNPNSVSLTKRHLLPYHDFIIFKLWIKHNASKTSYITKKIEELMFNDPSLYSAKFKEYLIYEDDTEFLRRFYKKEELRKKLKHILFFYDKYSKIFPNYTIMNGSKFMYKNIQKKQKMIDNLQEIKNQEEYNKKHPQDYSSVINTEEMNSILNQSDSFYQKNIMYLFNLTNFNSENNDGSGNKGYNLNETIDDFNKIISLIESAETINTIRAISPDSRKANLFVKNEICKINFNEGHKNLNDSNTILHKIFSFTCFNQKSSINCNSNKMYKNDFLVSPKNSINKNIISTSAVTNNSSILNLNNNNLSNINNINSKNSINNMNNLSKMNSLNSINNLNNINSINSINVINNSNAQIISNSSNIIISSQTNSNNNLTNTTYSNTNKLQNKNKFILNKKVLSNMNFINKNNIKNKILAVEKNQLNKNILPQTHKSKNLISSFNYYSERSSKQNSKLNNTNLNNYINFNNITNINKNNYNSNNSNSNSNTDINYNKLNLSFYKKNSTSISKKTFKNDNYICSNNSKVFKNTINHNKHKSVSQIDTKNIHQLSSNFKTYRGDGPLTNRESLKQLNELQKAYLGNNYLSNNLSNVAPILDKKRNAVIGYSNVAMPSGAKTNRNYNMYKELLGKLPCNSKSPNNCKNTFSLKGVLNGHGSPIFKHNQSTKILLNSKSSKKFV